MINIFKDLKPHIGTEKDLPVRRISKKKYDEETREMVKLIKENKKIIEEFERNNNGFISG